MPYGTPYDTNRLLEQPFDPAAHQFPLESEKNERILIAPRWNVPDTWQPIVREFINSHEPSDGSLLRLYADRDSKEVYNQVAAYLSELGADDDRCPDIEILGTLPDDDISTFILTGSEIDSKLQRRFPDKCLHMEEWLQAA